MGESWFTLTQAGVAIVTSCVALVVSGYSLYATVLKRPVLGIYQPPLIYMYRQGSHDVFAIPITVSNDGAQRGTVLSFDLEVLDAFPQSLIFSSESRERVVIFPKIGDPINRSLGSDLQRPHNPHQQSAERLIFQLAARGRDQNVNRQKETETSAQRNLILTKKSEHGRLDCQNAYGPQSSEPRPL